MIKSVYCKIPPQTKLIKFEPKEHVPDVVIIRDRLVEITKSDILLSKKFRHKIILLQHQDSNGVLIDIENDDTIADKSTVHVLLEDDGLGVSNTEIEEVNHRMLNSAPPAKQIHPSMSPDNSDLISGISNNNNDVDIEPQIEEPPPKKTKVMDSENLTEMDATKKTNDMSKEPKSVKNKKRNNTLSVPIKELPELSAELECRIQSRGVIACSNKFNQFYGPFLWKKVGSHPSRKDYASFSSLILNRHHELAGASGDHDISLVKDGLSQWFRNERQRQRLLGTRLGITAASSKASTSISKATIDDSTSTTQTSKESDVAEALKELSKNYIPGSKNEKHAKKLLQVTKTVRRNWIENEASRVEDVIDRYPVFAEFNIILFECIEVIFAFTVQGIFDSLKNLEKTLFQFFFNKDGLDYESSTDHQICELYVRLFQELCPRTLRKKADLIPILQVKQVNDKDVDVESSPEEAPRATLIFDNGELSQAFIIADGCIEIEMENCSPRWVVLGVLASYYTFHRQYPKPYKGMLQYLSEELFCVASDQPIVAKFRRLVQNSSKEKAQK